MQTRVTVYRGHIGNREIEFINYVLLIEVRSKLEKNIDIGHTHVASEGRKIV